MHIHFSSKIAKCAHIYIYIYKAYYKIKNNLFGLYDDIYYLFHIYREKMIV